MPKRKLIGPCSVIGCGRPIETRTFCQKHYMRLWQFGRLEKIVHGDKRSHPLYMLWWDRKSNGALCPEWLDFSIFAADVGQKPGPNFFLLKKRPGLFGPDNFHWVEHMKRRPGETKKEWWARKWQARMAANPGIERKRTLFRKYGVTAEQYDSMFAEQGGACAICEEPETSADIKTGSLKKLAVDHCHSTGKIRGLLCVRCNTTLGKIEESPQLLRAMFNYLHKHSAI